MPKFINISIIMYKAGVPARFHRAGHRFISHSGLVPISDIRSKANCCVQLSQIMVCRQQSAGIVGIYLLSPGTNRAQTPDSHRPPRRLQFPFQRQCNLPHVLQLPGLPSPDISHLSYSCIRRHMAAFESSRHLCCSSSALKILSENVIRQTSHRCCWGP